MKPSQILKMISLIGLWLFLNNCSTNNALIQTPQSNAPAQIAKVSVIQKIKLMEEENYTRIHVEGSETIPQPFYKLLSDPLRITIDVPNIDLKQIKSPIKVDNGTISDILITQYEDKGRIEIGLAQMANYNISKEDKNLIIDIEKVKRITEVKEIQKEEEVGKGKGTEEITHGEPKKEEPLAIKPVIAPSVPEEVNPAREIIDCITDQSKDYITYQIIADGKFGNYNAFKLDSPPRLVLDIWEVGNLFPNKSIKIENPFIKEVRIGLHPDKMRFVFDSLKPELPPYQLNRMHDKLIVSFGNIPQSSGPQISIQEKFTERESLLKGKGMDSEIPLTAQIKTPSIPEGAKKFVKSSTLTGIDFKQIDNQSRIIVTLSEEPKFESYMFSKRTIAIDIKNAFVQKHLRRGLDTSEFDSAVNYIHLQNVKTGKENDIRILIKLREEVPFETIKEGKVLYIDIERPKKIEAKIEVPPIPQKEEVSRETKKEEVKREEIKPLPELKKTEKVIPAVEEKPALRPQVLKKVEEDKRATEGGPTERDYTGRKLSLDFKDADIKNILRLIAEVSNLNIITGDDVTGKITMRLVDVPWDQALDIILQAKSLGMSRVGNVIRVAPLDTLKKEIQGELEAKRAKERLEDLVTELIPVNYASGKEIIPQVKGILSDRGDVKVDERTNILIVKDIAKNIVGVKNLVKSLDTKTPQVMIEARIIEATLTFQQELGVSWGFLASTGSDKKTGTVKGGILENKVVNLPAGGSAGIIEFLFNSQYGLKELDIAISAHENKGDVKIISSPKIATLDNKEASIEQGLRIPYLKQTTEGTVTMDFMEANLKLTVTPHVTNDGNIKLMIKAKKDAPDTSIRVQDVPAIDKKEAITEVLIRDNGVVVIGGIYTIEKNETNEGVPLFNKIPLLGWLFKKETKQDKRKDLMIFISPKVIKDQV